MHGIDNPQILQTGMRDFAFNKGPWDHPDNLAASGQSRICNCSHESDGGSPVNQTDLTLSQ